MDSLNTDNKIENHSNIIIKSSDNPLEFISKWDTTKSGFSANNEIRLPLVDTGEYNFTVDWGDESSSNITSYDQFEITHAYGTTGIYILNITGIINGWRFNDDGDCLKIIEISQWGCLQLGNEESYFNGCSNLNLTASDNLNLTGTTSLYEAFRDCTNLGDDGNMNGWNVSKITDMEFMFDSATTFNQSIGNWNISSVITMKSMFDSATSFNQPIGNWNFSKIENMRAMFNQATSFNQSIGDWNVSSVTSMMWMFRYAESFNQPIGSWNVSNVENMASMFDSATVFNQPIGNWNVSKVNTMVAMFGRADTFNQDIGLWNITSLINVGLMFSDAISFNQTLNDWNISSVTLMYGMFSGAISFNQNISKWDVSSVTNMVSLFDDADAFNQDISAWNVSRVTFMNYMFNNADIFNQNLSKWDVSSVNDMDFMFRETKLFNNDISTWNVSSVTSMREMFSNSLAFNHDISSWNVTNVVNMDYMFWDASVFNQDISSWNVSNVNSMEAMFSGAIAFNQDISSWNVSNVGDMSWMFSDAALFNQNIGIWNVSSVYYMDHMFYSATNFDQDLGAWNVSRVTTMSSMLSGITLSIENYDSLLINWALLDLQNDVQFTAENSIYSASASTARQYIISTFNWNIYDGGQEILVPEPPELDAISGPSITGNITLDWNTVEFASFYYIYRSTSEITDVTGLIFIANITESTYFDENLLNGNYYYVIISANNSGNSSISNCENITVEIPSIILNQIISPSTTGNIVLSWNIVDDISSYYVYRSNCIISDATGLTFIANVTEITYNDFGLTDGTYFYIIIADRISADSLISNCENVIIDIPSLILNQLTNPSTTGNNTLSWNFIVDAKSYYVYRAPTEITDISGLIFIANITETSYIDSGLSNGTYYYLIVAERINADSLYSNCVDVTVEIMSEESSNNIDDLIIYGSIIGGLVVGVSVVLILRKKRK